MSYAVRPATASDLTVLNDWVVRPHVAEWWEDGFDADDLADPRTRAWIVTLEGRPFAYLQDYAVHGFGEHHFDYLPAGARGIDQFIGEAALIGRGHGSTFVRQHVERLWREGAAVVGVDPHPDNKRAIAAYARAGFTNTDRVLDTRWGRARLMEAWSR